MGGGLGGDQKASQLLFSDGPATTVTGNDRERVKAVEMNALSEPLSLDALIANPAMAAMLPPETAQALLIGLASIQPILIQQALRGACNADDADLLLTI